jgi:TetR/AcrR family transcriptional regulator
MSKSQRTLGRPRNESNEGIEPRQVLIETAARLFGEQGYAETSLKAVANGAQVTPAMIAYYFKDKPGLLEAVTLSGLERLMAALEAAVDEDESEEAFAPRFIRTYLSTINESPWIPQILIREVVSRDTPLRQLFIDRFASRALKIVPPRVMAEIESGRLRHDLDPRYTLLSLVGMCLFPYLAQPVLGPLLDYQFDEAFGEQYTNHVLKLFLDGAAGARP